MVTFTPTLMFAANTMAILSAAARSCAFCALSKPVVPITIFTL